MLKPAGLSMAPYVAGGICTQKRSGPAGVPVVALATQTQERLRHPRTPAENFQKYVSANNNCCGMLLVMGVSKQFILREIRRLAEENGGVPPGKMRFATVTGIGESKWHGIHWVRWNDAVREAGFTPNTKTAKHGDERLLECLMHVIRKLGRFPTRAELRYHCAREPGFPKAWSIFRLGKKAELIVRLLDYCANAPPRDVASSAATSKPGHADETTGDEDTDHEDSGYEDVIAICAPLAEEAAEASGGFVYLFRCGRRYKIGRTKSVAQRRRRIASQLPHKLSTVHVIRTDDPPGVEGYWHKRFADKRVKGEWFALEPDDVETFKARDFM